MTNYRDLEDIFAETMEKHTPVVGEHLYTSPVTSLYWVSITRTPYTVIAVKGDTAVIQQAECVFYGDRYFDTLPDDIVEDKNGRIKKLRYSKKDNAWYIIPREFNTKVEAHFGMWDYVPYMD